MIGVKILPHVMIHKKYSSNNPPSLTTKQRLSAIITLVTLQVLQLNRSHHIPF
jgi:hypothetical protein